MDDRSGYALCIAPENPDDPTQGTPADVAAWFGVEPDAALLRALRRRGDEAQLTAAIAAIASADGKFTRSFVQLLLDAAAAGPRRAQVRRMLDKGVPSDIECRAEAHLASNTGSPLGRVDLRFDGDGFTLFVENKLHSGYGRLQLERYAQAIETLPPSHRSALIAVTRNYPTQGERALEDHEQWLGSIRWANLQDGLARLPVTNRLLGEQWRRFLQIVVDDGDLGSTQVDGGAVRAWAQYLEGRDELNHLLAQVWEACEERLAASADQRYKKYKKPGEFARLYRKGRRGQVAVQWDQQNVYVGFCVPAITKEPIVWVTIAMDAGEPVLKVEVRPWDPKKRTGKAGLGFRRAAAKLEDAGFETDGWIWDRPHLAGAWLDADDVPDRLIELAGKDLEAVVDSGILDLDVETGLTRRRNGPARHKRIPQAPA